MSDRWLAWVEKASFLRYKYNRMSVFLFAELVTARHNY